MQPSNILLIGYGAWGQALHGIVKSNGHHVTIYTRRDDIHDITAINYDIIILAIPVHGYDAMLSLLANHAIMPKYGFIIVSKGMDAAQRIPSTIINHHYPNSHYAVLSGPNFAHEIQQQQKALSLLSSNNDDLLAYIVPLFHCTYFRIYTHHDPISVQYLGALKNIYAIGAGIIIGLNLGDNARAGYVTRACAEMAAIIAHIGGKQETSFGLSGLGDFLLTASSSKSRNTAFGIKLAEGLPQDTALQRSQGVVEGYYAAKPMYDMMHKGCDTPILQAIVGILHDNTSIKTSIDELFSRPIKQE